MPGPDIKLKIDVTKILKAHLFKGAKGTYLDVSIWPNRDGEDQYGFTHRIVQEVSREARESGVKGPIIGNAKIAKPAPSSQQRPASAPKRPPTDPDLDSTDGPDIPF